jgi:hypothetical protein
MGGWAERGGGARRVRTIVETGVWLTTALLAAAGAAVAARLPRTLPD